MKRKCEICGSKHSDVIHKQKFVLENNYLFNYNVVACRRCGFIFASNLPSPKKLEKFYKENVKYAYQHNHSNLPDYAKKLHLDSFQMVDSYLKLNFHKFNKSAIRILDIGCATGYLLDIFKKNRYKSLLGIDPSPECSVAAKKLYNIKVLPLTLSEYKTKEKYDFIILGSVLEHLNELDKNISKTAALLKEDGILFISIPDGDNFGRILREPFLEFSLEHINYFTRESLTNLLGKYGLENVIYESCPVDLYGGYALNSLWKKRRYNRQIAFDKKGKEKILNYIEKSSKKLEKINRKIHRLVKSQEEIIIWGVGSLASRLLATTELKKANIKAFVDSNINLQGKKILGKFISSPEILHNQKHTVFVSSYIHRDNILNVLKKDYNYAGKIITLN